MLQRRVSLLPYNTFGIAAEAALFFRLESAEQLNSLWKTPLAERSTPLILGGGSNIVFSRNYPGLVLRNEIKGITLVRENAQHVFVRFGAGEVWHQCVEYAINQQWGGIENLSLIPGTIGAAPIQNIGAYGVELKETFHSLEAFDMQTHKTTCFDASECRFGYRDSIFKQEAKGRYIILSVTLRLTKHHEYRTTYGDIQQALAEAGVKTLSLRAVSDAIIGIRRKKLPDPAELGNCGSFFKNPVISRDQFETFKAAFPDIRAFPAGPDTVKIPAAWLIEQDGWKGKRVGNTGSHRMQALVLVNYGGATGEEVARLADDITQSVFTRFGIRLEREVNII
jgi:UDP-N-acetylmuramate dehydrogenase